MNIIVVDTETTGLGGQDSREDAIVQIGAVVVRDGMIIDEFNSCCWPGEKYFIGGRANYALMINNLSIDKLRSSPHDDIVAMKFREWMEQYLTTKITAYNVAFDRPFLEQKPWSLQETVGLTWGSCIMLYAAEYLGERGMNRRHPRYGNWKWKKLEEVARFLGVALTNAHDAMGDAKAAAEIMLKMGMDV